MLRKGVMFSFIMVFLILTLLALIAVHKSLVTYQRERLSIETRIKDMNSLYESIIRDVDKTLSIITKRAMSASVSHVITLGHGLENADSTLEELIINGTLNSTPEGLMEDSTFPDWMGKMEQVGELKGYYLDLGFENFEVKPYDSFNLLIVFDMHVNITDKRGIASLTRDVDVESLVSIEGFDDPLYSLNTLGRATNTITKTSSEGNYTELLVSGNGMGDWKYGISVVIPSSNTTGIQDVNEKYKKILVTDDALSIDVGLLNAFLGVVSEGGISEDVVSTYVFNAEDAMESIPDNINILIDGDMGKVWDIDNLKEHAENSYYASSDEGASFLDRLEGKLTVQDKYSSQTDDMIGLESFVDKMYLMSLDLLLKQEQTNIDYLYFSDNTVLGDSIKGIDTWFRIDDGPCLGSTRQEIYGVSGLVIS